MSLHEFTCPKCGGHCFKSNQLPEINPMTGLHFVERYCSTIGDEGQRCSGVLSFKWHQKDDDKYLKKFTMEEWMADLDKQNQLTEDLQSEVEKGGSRFERAKEMIQDIKDSKIRADKEGIELEG